MTDAPADEGSAIANDEESSLFDSFGDTTEVEALLSEQRGPDMPPSGTDDETLRLTRDEARSILDHRLEWLSETDDKAMRTVRTAVIVLSIIFSAAGIAGEEALNRIPRIPFVLSSIGVVGLFLTIIYGIYTYSDSETVYGPEPALRREVLDYEYSERQWLVMLLNGYDEWIDVMERVNKRNAKHLSRVQYLLVLSLFFLLLALGAIVMNNPSI